MSEYQTGIETRSSIIDACRGLFYEKGFDKTTFVDICKAASVNQGSIHYHFKNKENILRTIYEDTIKKNNAAAEAASPPGTLMYTKYFFGGEIYLYKMEADEKFLRFNIDASRLLNSANLSEFIFSQAQILYFDEGFPSEPTALDCFETMASLAFDNIVRLYVANNSYGLGYHQISELSIEIYRRILCIGDSDFQLIKEQLHALESSFPWEALDTTLDSNRIFVEER